MGYLMATCEFALANPELHDQFSQYIKELSMKL